MKQVQDHYFKKAKREGLAARSAYKLEEIDKRRRLLRPGARVLDLGSAPGSWLQYAASVIGERGLLTGVDLQPITANLPSFVRCIQGDVFQLSPADLDGGAGQFDVILSDMAPKTTGIPSADAARSADLVDRVLTLSRELLRPKGKLLVKVLQGGGFPELRKSAENLFDTVRVEKPRASRKESVELFLLGEGKRG